LHYLKTAGIIISRKKGESKGKRICILAMSDTFLVLFLFLGHQQLFGSAMQLVYAYT
jgi:hypothetical protein